jgi:hypothetical protein
VGGGPPHPDRWVRGNKSRVRRQQAPHPALVMLGPVHADGASLASMTTCDFCGTQESDEAKTLTWTVAVENGRRRTFCDTCSRDHLRAMEGKLDSEWW